MKRENIYLTLLIIASLLLWDAKCSGNKNTETITTEPIKVSIPYSKKRIVSKPITSPTPSKPLKNKDGQKTDNLDIYKNDSINAKLLADNEILIANYKNANDSLKIALFEKSIQVSDFEKTTETDTYKARQFGKVRGEVLGLGLDFELKPQKQAVQKKWMVLGGIEATTNNTVNGKVFYYSKSGVMYFGGYGTNSEERFKVGVAGKLFGN